MGRGALQRFFMTDGIARQTTVAIDGEKLRALRGQRKQREIAALCGVSVPTIARGESPDARLSWRILERVAAALAVTAESLLADRPGTAAQTRRPAGFRWEDESSLGLGSSIGMFFE